MPVPQAWKNLRRHSIYWRAVHVHWRALRRPPPRGRAAVRFRPRLLMDRSQTLRLITGDRGLLKAWQQGGCRPCAPGVNTSNTHIYICSAGLLSFCRTQTCTCMAELMAELLFLPTRPQLQPPTTFLLRDAYGSIAVRSVALARLHLLCQQLITANHKDDEDDQSLTTSAGQQPAQA